MNCPTETQEGVDLLLNYCARKLDTEQMATVERHLAQCPACARFRTAQGAVWTALDQWEPAEVSPDFDRRLYRRIESEERRPWWRRALAPSSGPGLLRPAVPLAALAGVVMVAGFLLNGPKPGTPAAAAGEPALVREVEQVERTFDDLEMLRQLQAAAGSGEEAAREL